MIIGTILETMASGDVGATYVNGASCLIFTVEEDAIFWAIEQSKATLISGVNSYTAVTTVINTETGVKRWWFNGTEYTG